jgi:hypothetical protein
MKVDSLTCFVALAASSIVLAPLSVRAAELPTSEVTPKLAQTVSDTFTLSSVESSPTLQKSIKQNSTEIAQPAPVTIAQQAPDAPLFAPVVPANPQPANNLEQVTSVSQLSDVRPTDWAFQALQSLVERYGCIAGYPDRTYRGNRALTRFEFAAGLNACLDLLAPNGEFAVEHRPGFTLPELPLVIVREKRYGNTALTFYQAS